MFYHPQSTSCIYDSLACKTELHLLIVLLQHPPSLVHWLLRTADHFVQTWDEGGALTHLLVNVMGLSGIIAISICDSIRISNNNISSITKRRNKTAQPQLLIVISPCSIGPVYQYLSQWCVMLQREYHQCTYLECLVCHQVLSLKELCGKMDQKLEKAQIVTNLVHLIWAMAPTDNF